MSAKRPFYRNRLPSQRLIGPAACASLLVTVAAYAEPTALPTGEQVQAGSADFTRDSSSLTIDQHTGQLVVNWDDFSIAQGNQVNFLQNASDIALNRVVGDNPSYIFGDINAGGQVFLINQSGILFSTTSRVDAAGLVASSLDISDQDFLSGNYTFSGQGGDVLNQGQINIQDGGYAALFGGQAINQGIISARLGTVALGAGDRVSFDLNGDGLINFRVEQSAVDALAANHGLIRADGGLVYMTAKSAGDLAATVVNNDGVIEATSIEERNGRVFLVADGGSLTSSGSIDVSGEGVAGGGSVTLDSDATTLVSGDIFARSGTAGGVGGAVQILGNHVGLLSGSRVDVSGLFGGGDILVGGDYQGANADIRNAARTYIGSDALLTANALQSGNGGKVIVWADDITRYYGGISATGGAEGGNGGFAEVSGKQNLAFWGSADLSAVSGDVGTLLLDPDNINIVAGAAGSFDDAELADDQILFADGSPGDFDITNGQLAAATAAVTLQANVNITVGAAVNMTQDLNMFAGDSILVNNVLTSTNALSLLAGNTVQVNADISAGTNLTLTGDADLTGFGLAASDGVGTVTFAAGTSIVAPVVSISGGENLALRDITANTSLDLVTSGDTITQVVGTGIAAGVTTVDVGSGANITLGSTLNDFSSVAVSNAGANNVSIRDVDDVTVSGDASVMQIVGTDVTLGGGTYGNLVVAASSSIGQTGAVTSTGALNIIANLNAVTTTLGNTGNDFNSVSLGTASGGSNQNVSITDGTGSVSLLGGATTLSLDAAGAVSLGGGSYGTLGLTAGGNVTQTGALTVSGTTNLTSDAAAIDATLNNASNELNTVNLLTSGGSFTTASITDADVAADGLTFGGNAVTANLVSAGDLTLTGGTFTTLNASLGTSVVQTGGVTVSGVTTLAATAAGVDATLTTASNNFNSVALNTSGGSFDAVSVTDTNALTIGGNATTLTANAGNALVLSGGTYTTLNAASAGGITETGGLTVSGTTTLTSNVASMTADLATQTNDFGTVTLVNGTGTFGDVNVADTNGFTFGGNAADVTLLFGGDLTLAGGSYGILFGATGGNVLQTGAVTVTGSTTFAATSTDLDITLTDAGNNFSSVLLNTTGGTFDTVTVTDANALSIGGNATTLNASAAGALTLTGGTYTTVGAIAGGDITQTGALDVSGTATLGSTTAAINVALTNAANELNTVVVSGTGAGSITTASITDADTAVDGLGVGGNAGTLTVDAAGAVEFTGGAYTTVNATAGGNITQAGAVTVSGVTTLTSDANAISVTLDTAANELNSVNLATSGAGSFTTVSLTDADTALNGLVVGGDATDLVIDAGGAFDLAGGTYNSTTVTAGGNITQSGALTVAATAAFTAGAGAITAVLNNAANEFNTVTFNTGGGAFSAASVVDADTATDGLSVGGNVGGLIADAAGALNFGGGTYSSIDATAGGNITQTGALTVSGTTNLTSDAAAIDATLNNASNELNTVNLLTSGGSFTTASITDADVAADGLTFGGNAVTANLVSAGDLTLTGGTFTTLNASLGTSVVQTGGVTVSGVTTLAATAAGVDATLTTASNNFNSVALNTSGGSFDAVSVTDTNALTIGGNATTLTANAGNALVLSGGTYTTLNAASAGGITETGGLTVSGTTTLTSNVASMTADLATQTNDFGTVTLVNGTGTFGDVNVSDTNGFTFGGDAADVTLLFGGDLTLAGGSYGILFGATGGNVLQTGAVTVTGLTTFSATGPSFNVTLNNAGNDFSTFALGGADFDAVSVTDANALSIGGNAATLTADAGGALTFTGGTYTTLNGIAGGNITQTGALNVSGVTNLTSDAAAITATLTTAANEFSAVNLLTTAGTFTSATITDADVSADGLGVGGNAGTLTVDAAGAVDFTGGSYTTVNAAAGGDISQSGFVGVSGITTLTANGTDINADLSNPGNAFGTVALVDGTGNFDVVSVADANTLSIGGNANQLIVNTLSAVDLTGGSYTTLDVTSAGNITQSGGVAVSGIATMTADTNAITLGLGSISNDFGTLALASVNGGSFNSATVFDPNTLIISGDAGDLTATVGTSLTLAGGTYANLDATVTTGSSLNQTGAVTVLGFTSITADVNQVTVDLSNAANNFAGMSFFTTAGGGFDSIAVTDANSLSVSSAIVSGAGDIDLIANSGLFVSGTIQTASGNITLNADNDGNGGVLNLLSTATVNSGGDLTFSAADFNFDAAATLSVAGNFDINFTAPGTLCLGLAPGSPGCVIGLDNGELLLLSGLTTDLELDNTGSAILTEAADFNGINVALLGTVIDDQNVGTGLGNIGTLTMTATGAIGANNGGLNVSATTVDVTATGGNAVTLVGDSAGATTYDIGSAAAVGAVSVTETVGNLIVTGVDSTSTVALQATTDQVQINGTISADDVVTVSGVGGIVLGADITTTDDDINLNSAVTLAAASALNTGAGIGNVTVTGAVDGAENLVITAGTGNVDLQGVIGGVTPLTSLTVNSATTTTFGGDVTTVGAQDITSGTIETNGTHTTTDSDILLTGDVSLLAATAFDSGAGAGDVIVTGAVDGGNNLVITAGTGDVDLQSNVGSVTPLGSLTINSATTASFGGNVTTLGGQSVAAGTIETTGLHFSDGSNIVFTGNLDLLGTTALDTNGATLGDITVTGTINGAHGLFLIAGTGNVDLQTDIGGTTPLTALTVTSAASATFGGDVTTAGAQSVTAGTINTNGTHTTTDSNILLTGNVALQAATAFNTGAGAGNVTVTGSIDGAQDLDITAGTGNVDLQSAAGGVTPLASLTINSATSANLAAVSSVGAQSVTADTINLNGTLLTQGGDIFLDGDVNLLGALQLNTGTLVGGDITVTGTVNGAQNPSVNAGLGNVDFQGDIGDVTPLTGLAAAGASVRFGGDVTTTGAQAATATTGTVMTNGTHTTTNSDIQFTGDLVLEASTVLDTGAGAGNVTVTGTTNGSTAGTESLDITAGTGNVSLGDVGVTTSLASLTVNSATAATFNGDVTTTGAQDITAGTINTNGTHTTTDSNILLTGNVALQAATAFNTGAGIGDVTVTGTIDGAQDLAITAGTGNVDLQGVVGGVTPLTSLTINSAANVDLQAAVTAGSVNQVAGTGTTTVGGALTSTTGDIAIATNQIVQNAAISSAGDVILDATADIALNTGVLSAANRLIHLIAGSGVVQDAANHGGLQATDLLLQGGGDFTLVTTTNDNLISNVASVGTVAGQVQFENDQALAIDAVDDAAAVTSNGLSAQTLLVRTSAGDLNVNQAATSTTGNLMLESQAANLAINAAVNGANHVTLLGNGTVTQAAAGDVVAGADLYVASTNGNDIIMLDGATSSATNSIIYETLVTGADIYLGSLSANTVRVSGANIIDNGDTDVDVIATNAVLRAFDNVGQPNGTGNGAIDTDAGTLAATSMFSGSVYVSDVDALVIGNATVGTYNRVNFDNSLTPGGGVVYTSSSAALNFIAQTLNDLTINHAVTATGGQLLLASTAGSVAINSAVEATASNISVDAGDSVTQAAAGDLTAGIDIDVQAVNDITMTDGAVSNAAGNVSYVAGGDITVASLDGTNVYVGAGNDIIDGGETDTDIIATTAQLVAGNSIGQAAGSANGPLDTDVTTLAASALAGNIYISEADDLIIGSVPSIAVNRVGLDGIVTPQAGSVLNGISADDFLKIETLAGGITVNAAVTATNNDLLLDAQAGDIALNNTVTATAGNASLLASANITQAAAGDVTAGGTLDVEAQGDITMTDGAVSTAGTNLRYLAGNNLVLGSLVGTNVRAEAVAAIIDGGETDNDIVATAAQLVAGSDIGTSADAIETQVGTLAVSAGTGDIFIAEADALNVGSVAAIDVLRVNIDSTTTNQSGVLLEGATAASDIVIRSNGALVIDNLVDATAGNLLLQSLGGTMDVNAAVSAGANASLLSLSTLTQSANGDITAGGTLDVAVTAGAINMADGAVSSAVGNARYQASGNINVGSIQGANVVIDTTGNIFDAGETDVDIIATNAQLIASTSVGQALGTAFGPLETTVTTLATSAGSGHIYLSETDDLVIGSVAAIDVQRVNTDATTTLQTGTVRTGASALGWLKVEAGGGITVDEAVQASNLDLLLDAQGGDLNLNNSVDAGGNMSLLSSGAIRQNAGANITAGGTLDVDAQGGEINMADSVSSTVAGNIRYLSSGDIYLSRLSGANVLVNAGGSIYDNGDTAVDVIATNAQLIATNAIGEADGTNNGLIETTVTTLAADAGNGGVFIDETDALVIGSVAPIDVLRVIIDSTTANQAGALLEGVVASNDVVVRANTDLTVSNPVQATAGNLLLRAETGNMQIDSTVDAGADLTLQATNGTLTQGAGGDVTAGGDLYVEANGVITMDDGAVSTATGNVWYLTNADLLVSSINGANVRLDVNGNIVDNGDTDIDVSAADAIFTAASIGQPAGTGNGALDTSVDNLVVQANDIFISETDDLILGDIVALNVSINTVGLDAASTLNPGSALSVNQATQNLMVEAAGSITVQTLTQAIAGNLLLDAQAGDLNLNNSVDATAGNVSLIASAAVFQNAGGNVNAGGTLDVQAQGGAIDMTDGTTSTAVGNIRYLASGDIGLTSLQSTGADVLVNAGGSIIDNGETDVDVIATNAQLIAANSIGVEAGTGFGPIETSVSTLAASAGSGDIYISETDNVTIGSVAAIDVLRVVIDNTTANQAGAVLAGATAAQDLMVEAGNGIIVDEAVLATAGNLLLDAQAGDLAINNTVTATAGNASLLASANVTQAAAGDVTAGGTLDVNAQGGDITMTDGAISTATGNIRYLATGDIRLASLQSSANVLVNAGGSIIDNGETDVDVLALNAQLLAVNSIGEIAGTNNGPLETTVTVVAADATNGNVYLFETDALEIGSVAAIDVERVNIDSTTSTQAGAQLDGVQAELEIDIEADDMVISQQVHSSNGNILLRARAGGINQSVATGSVVADNGNITLLADSGDILLQLVSALGNQVTLTASNQIINNNSAATNVIADVLVASANDFIGDTAGYFTDPDVDQRITTEVEDTIDVTLAVAGTVGIDNTSTDGSVDVIFNLPLADVSNGSSVWVRTSEAMRALGLEFATLSNSVEFNGNLQLIALNGDLTLNEAQVGDANDVNLVAQWMRLEASRGAFLNGDGSRFQQVGDGLILTADDLVIVTGGDLGVEATVDRLDITGTGLYQVAPAGTPGSGGENADLDLQLSKRDITVVDDAILFESIVITRPGTDPVPSWITDLDSFYPYTFDENNYGLFSTGTARVISLRQDDGVNTTHDGSITFSSNVNVGALSTAADLTLEVRAGQFNTSEYAGTVYVAPAITVLAENIGRPDTGSLAAFGNVLVDGSVVAREERSIEAQGRGGDIIIDSDTSAAGRVLLSPGQGFDVIFTNAATFRVTQGLGAEGDLVILAARNVLMDPGTQIIADGSVLIGADNITGSLVPATGTDAVEGDIVLYDVLANANGNGIGDIVVYTTGGRAGETYTAVGPGGPITYTVTGSITLGRQDVLDDLLAQLALDPTYLDTPANVPAPALQAVNVVLVAADSINSGWAMDYAAGNLTPDQELVHVVASQDMTLNALGGVVGGTGQIATPAGVTPTEQPLRVIVGNQMNLGAGRHDGYGVSVNLVGEAVFVREIGYVPGLILFNEWGVGGALLPKFVSGTSVDFSFYEIDGLGVLYVQPQQVMQSQYYSTHSAVWDANMEPGQPQPVAAMWSSEGGGIAGGVNVLLDPAKVGSNWTFKRYEVVSGDTLWAIAEKYLGDPLRWPEIWWLTEGMEDPNLIEPGQQIHLEAEDIRRLQELKAEEDARDAAEADAAGIAL